MSVINNGLLLASEAAAAGSYTVSRSLRFNAADSAYLSRTPGSAGNRRTWTWSAWVKRSVLGTNQRVFTSQSSGVDAYIRFRSDNTLQIYDFSGGYDLRTTQVFRDTSAWFHLLIDFDTGNATQSDRIQLYVNGSRVTAWSTASWPTQNLDTSFNIAAAHYISGEPVNSEYFSGYLADVHLIDGSALTPSSFAETNTTTGQWVPKAYTGSYGTNGFRLTFSDNSGTTSTTLGKDAAGSSNWTPNNFSVATGAGNDSLVDTPTSYGTDTSVGGEVRGNYCTWNPLDKNSSLNSTNGNLDANAAVGVNGTIRGTIGISSGKWYWEYLINNTSPAVGIATAAATLADFPGSDANGYSYTSGGQKWNNNSGSSYGATYTTNDIIGVALDLDAGTLVFYKNGVSQGTAYSGLPVRTYFPAGGRFGGTFDVTLNAGQRPFAYTAPSGFKALVDTNIPVVIAKPSTVFDTVLWTGNGSSQSITLPGGFSPDLVWLKQRNGTDWHGLFNTIVGATTRLFSNSTNAEATNAQTLTSFNSNGFSVGNTNEVNGNNNPYVAWCWDAGSSTVTNTQGSITSTVRANASAGFSIVTYTGTGATGGTVGHGLGAAPGMIICKSRDNAPYSWIVWHKALTVNESLILNSTAAVGTYSNTWGSSLPSSTVFGVTAVNGANNNTGSMIAYCFAPVAGYSAFGSYTGNGSTTDGTFVYTGMRPRFVLIKRTNTTGNWILFDSARDSYNVGDRMLFPNLSNAETQLATDRMDFLSNGFKLRAEGGASNGNGDTIIYAAFAESPFNYARAR